MSIYFTKLFASITESTIWVEPHPIRLTWITMLAMADRKGRVFGSIPGLANRARVTVEECEDAINRFLSPDKYSRTPDNEGRRIKPIDGGWLLLNHAKYRAIQDDETIRETKRAWAQRNRESTKVDKIDNGRQPKIQAEADIEAEAINTKKKRTRLTALPDGFCISERVSKWATEKGHHHLTERLEQFVGYAKRSGKTYADWDEAFMSAIREDWAKLDGKTNGSKAPWWTSEAGIVAKGRECGLEARPGESMNDFKGRIERMI